MSDLNDLVRALTTGPAVDAPIESIDDWWARHCARTKTFARPVDRAIAGGFGADRLGYAFASGYREALVALLRGGDEDGIVVLAATEEGGAKPSAIRTSLTKTDGGWSLSGKKRWATLATRADALLVVATTGDDEGGRRRLRIARVPTARAGLTIRPMPAPPFAPEIAHAELVLDGVAVACDELLAGDGWDEHVKPFRTIEDVHVHAALAGYLVGVVRRHALAPELEAELVAAAALLRALAGEDPRAPEVHVALAGALASTRRIVERLEAVWVDGDVDERARWDRDRALLDVAAGARAQRTLAARRRLDASSRVAEPSALR
jgi:alkylation response protein AidB-like acyl-CoA dehydrogenase